MTKDELKKEAEKYGIDLCAYCRECEGEKPCQHKLDAIHGYQDGLKAREKRIAELETTCNKWFEHLKNREEELLNELYNQNAKYNKQIEDLEKENADLKEEINKIAFARGNLEEENTELRKVAEFQQSSNMSRHFENKKLKEGLAIGSILNKGLNSLNKALEEERDKYRNMVFDKDKQLTNAKEIIKNLLILKNDHYGNTKMEWRVKVTEQAEQFLKEVEK